MDHAALQRRRSRLLRRSVCVVAPDAFAGSVDTVVLSGLTLFEPDPGGREPHRKPIRLSSIAHADGRMGWARGRLGLDTGECARPVRQLLWRDTGDSHSSVSGDYHYGYLYTHEVGHVLGIGALPLAADLKHMARLPRFPSFHAIEDVCHDDATPQAFR